MIKRALAVISFGTSYPQARRAIEKIEKRLEQARPDHDFYRAFTSRIIVDKIEREEGQHIMTPLELMEELKADGYDEVICQSLHMIRGHEFDKLCTQLATYQSAFEHFALGAPLLSTPKDLIACARALFPHLPPQKEDHAMVWMGHGTDHPADSIYARAEKAFRESGYRNTFVGTVEGSENIENVIERLHAAKIKSVTLAPLMIVAGDHAQNDLAGDEPDSWKKRLLAEGFAVSVMVNGLGEYDEIGELFVQRMPQ